MYQGYGLCSQPSTSKLKHNAFSQERRLLHTRFALLFTALHCTALHCPPLRCMLLPLANIRRPHSGFAGTRLPQPCTWNIGVHRFLAFSCARSLDWLRRLIVCFCMYYMVRDVQGPAVRKEAPHLSQDKSKEGLGELYEKEVRLCGSALLCSVLLYAGISRSISISSPLLLRHVLYICMT